MFVSAQREPSRDARRQFFAIPLRLLPGFEHVQNLAIACGCSAIPCERLVFRKPCGRCAHTMRLDDCDWTTATVRSDCDRKKPHRVRPPLKVAAHDAVFCIFFFVYTGYYLRLGIKQPQVHVCKHHHQKLRSDIPGMHIMHVYSMQNIVIFLVL